MNCNICNKSSELIFEALILNKYNIDYFKCSDCGFIQTEKPYWLEEAYQSAITDLDIGLIQRNIGQSKKVFQIIDQYFDKKKPYLDFGGGYGMFVRLMRDRGLDFYRQDFFCENLFANHFDMSQNPSIKKFEAVTAFEVFEHMDNPKASCKEMFEYADNILFSTLLQPNKTFKSADDWWYFTPLTGQHLSLYSRKSLEKLAEQFGANYYTNGVNLHLITKNKFSQNPMKDSFVRKVNRKLNRNLSLGSLQKADLKLIKSKLQ